MSALRFVFGVFFAVALMAGVQSASAKEWKEMVLGDPDAPIKIIEYSSLTCPHCAAFHRDTLPQIKKEFLDTGKAQLIYRDFQLGARAELGAMVAHCASDEAFFPFLDMLFAQQQMWARAQNPQAALVQLARFGGITPEQLNECFRDADLYNGVKASYNVGVTKYGVQSTPTFIIQGPDGEEKVVGNQSFDTFVGALEDVGMK